MCFAPQRRALFRHCYFQKCSEHGVFCTFWLRNVLRAITACAFSTSQLPKMVQTRQFLTHFTSKCASRHNGVQFFISHLASWLRTRRFSEPTFRPSGASNHWKNTVSRLSYPFAHLHLLSSYSFSSTLLSSNLSLLSASSLLCFSSVHIVESLTSKLPSNILYSFGYSGGLPHCFSGLRSVFDCVKACSSLWLTLYFHIFPKISHLIYFPKLATWQDQRPRLLLWTFFPALRCWGALVGMWMIFVAILWWSFGTIHIVERFWGA